MPHYFNVGPNIPQPNIPQPNITQAYIPRPIDPSVVLLGVNKLRTNQQVSPFSDYNDPTQINSLADVIWDTIHKNDNLKRKDYGILSDIGDWDIPLISNAARFISSTGDLVLNTVVEPIKQKNPMALGLNALVNFGETLDILASPIKGLVLDGPEGLVKGSVGRVNYDIDSGNILLDLAAEIVLDPFNWISLGGKAAISSGVKGVLASSIDDVAQAAGNKIIKEGVSEYTKESLKKELITAARKELMDSSGKLVVNNADDIMDSLLRAANRIGEKYFDDTFLYAIRNKQISKLAPQYVHDLSILKGITKIADLSETVEKRLFQGAMYTNFIPIDLLKRVKDWGMYKHYTNKIITQVQQITNGFADAKEVTKFANYKTVTEDKKVNFATLKINEILKSAGIDELDYIDIDKAFSDEAINTIRTANLYIEDYHKTHDFATLTQRLVNDFVPQDLLPADKDVYTLYNTLIETMESDLNLIRTKFNKDGIKVFSSIESAYTSLKNTIENVFEYDETLRAIKVAQREIIAKDAILTPLDYSFVTKYKQNTNKYLDAYKNLLTRLTELDYDLSKEILSPKSARYTVADIQKIADRYIKHLTVIKKTKANTDVLNFLDPAIKLFKEAKTLRDLNKILKALDDTAEKYIQKLTEAQFIKTLYSHSTSKTIGQIENQVIRHKAIAQYTELLLKTINEDNIWGEAVSPKKALKELFARIEDFTKGVPVSNRTNLEGTMNYVNKTISEIKNIVEPGKMLQRLRIFRDTLKNKNQTSMSVARYGDYLLSNTPAVTQYKALLEELNQKQKAFNKADTGKLFEELRDKSAGGFSAFNKIEEQAGKLQHFSDNPVLMATSASPRKKTVFNTKNTAITTLDTPEKATETFIKFFGEDIPEDSKSGTFKLLRRIRNKGDLSYDENLMEQCNSFVADIREFREGLRSDPHYFENPTNLDSVQNFFKDLKLFVHSVQTTYAESTSKYGGRVIGQMYDEDGKPMFLSAKKTTTRNSFRNLISESYELDSLFERTGDLSGLSPDIDMAEYFNPYHKELDIVDLNDDLISETEDVLIYRETATGETEGNTIKTYIESALEELGQISTFDTSNKMFQAGSVGVFYAAKDENLAILYNSLSSDVGLAQHMKAFTEPENTVSKELKAIIEDTTGSTDQATKISGERFFNDVLQFESLSQFFTRLNSDPDIPDGFRRAVTSSLESFKNEQLGNIDEERFLEELFEHINNFIYGVDSTHSLSIQNLLSEADVKINLNADFAKRYAEDFTDWERKKFNTFLKGGETHQAADDAFVQDMLIRLFLPDEYIKEVITDGKNKVFINKNGGKIHIADCETSSKRGEINELAHRVMGSDTASECPVFKVEWYEGRELPQNEVLQKMFPNSSYEEAVTKYKELYNPKSEINKKGMAEGTVFFYSSEREMLQGYKDYLNTLPAGDEVIMHNGFDFDYPTIRRRAYENGVYFNTKKLALSDSFVEMKDHLPIIKVDSLAKIKVANYIKQYLAELPDNDLTIQFLSGANYGTLINLIEFQKNLTNNLSNAKYSQDLLNALNSLKDRYFNLLNANEKISASANNILISKEFFQTKEGQEIFLNEVKVARDKTRTALKNTNLSNAQRAEYELYLKQLDDTLELANLGILTNNISRTMYIDRFEGDPTLGFYRAIDLDTARNYMDIPDKARLTDREMKDITNFVRPLKRSYDAIKNTTALKENKDKIFYGLQNIIKAFNTTNNVIAPSWLKYIRINPEDYKTNYIVLQKLYNQYTKRLNTAFSRSGMTITADIADSLNTKYRQIQKKITEVFGNDEELLNILDNSKKVVYTSQSPQMKVFDSVDGAKAYTAKFTDNIKSNPIYEYAKYKTNFDNIMETGLKGLSDSIDGTVFTSAFKFKTAQQASKLSAALDSLIKFLDSIPEPTKQAEIIQNIEQASDLIKINIAKQITELPKEQLLNHLLTNGMFLQVDTKWLNNFDKDILAKFLERADELKALNIEMEFNEDLGTLFVYPNKNVAFNVTIDPVTNKSIYEINGESAEPNQLLNIDISEFLGFLPDDVRATFKEAQDSLNILSDGLGVGTTYEVIDKTFFANAYSQLPKRIQNNMLNLEYFLKDGLFNRTRFNTTILGPQQFSSMYGEYIPGDFIKGYLNSFTTLASRASDKANYIEMILHKDFSINNGVINELSFDELRKMLEDAPEFNLACLTYNKSGDVELIDLKLNTEVDFQFAKKNNAVILPYHVFANAYQVINSKMYEEMNPVVAAMTKIMHAYKRGYLMSGGMIMRNTIDTFAKNINIANGNAVEALSKTMDAMKLYMTYNDTLNAIFKSSGMHRINKKAIAEFFESGLSPKMTYEEFSFVHEVLNSGALIGEVKSLDNYRLYSKARKEGKDISSIADLNDPSIKYLIEDYDSIKYTMNGFMKVNNDIENIQRLSAYMLLKDQGFNFTEAVYRVSKDHFNYSMKSPREKLIELIIPFYTFKLNNLQYWAEAFVDNPWIAGLFEDVMTPIWNFDDVDENELQYNRSLQYRILSGNLQLADNGLTLKLNPSASDAFKLMTNPLGEIYNSIFAGFTFITDMAITQIAESTGNQIALATKEMLNIYKPANPTKLDTVKSLINLVPYGAIAQRFITGAEYAKEIGNILPAITPSVFGRTKQFETKTFNNTRNYSKYSSGKRKSRKIYSRKTYPRKIYSKKPYNRSDYYPINFKQIYIDGMYSVPNISTYTAKANRYYHFSRLNNLPTVSIYDKLYNSRGKPRWDSMLQNVTPQNLKYVIKNTIHYK